FLMCGLLLAFVEVGGVVVFAQDPATQSPTAQFAGRAFGIVTAVNGQVIKLKTDAGVELSVTVSEIMWLLQLRPGEKDLKQATPLALADLKTGDRILVRGLASADGKSLQATSVIAMKQIDIADKQVKERMDW